MKTILQYTLALVIITFSVSCSKEGENTSGNDLTLHFNNTFKNTTIVLGTPGNQGAANAVVPTKNTSANGQEHFFTELKYVISNIRLIKADGQEMPYFTTDLDQGAVVVNQAKASTLDFVLKNIPNGEYKEIRFGLGVKHELNTLDEVKFPKFYTSAGANDTKMMWEWGTGYRFTKIEGFYSAENKPLSIHTGSTLDGEEEDPATYVPGVDAYREIKLSLPKLAKVGNGQPRITVKADFDKLLSGKSKITLGAGNALPSIHSAADMVIFVDNLGGNGTDVSAGMFSIQSVEN